MNAWVFGLAATWLVLATALCALLSAGNRHSRRQHRQAAQALAARRAARHTPAWARTDHHNHGRHRR